MSIQYVYLVTGAESRAGRTRSPVIVFINRRALVAFLRANAADPTNDEAVDVDSAVVFRLRPDRQYFANAPLTAREVLARGTFRG